MRRGLVMFPVGAAGGFLCGFVIAFLSAWFDGGLGDFEATPLTARDHFVAGIAFGGFGGVIGLVLAPVVYLFCFRQLTGQELVKATLLIVTGTIAFGLLAGLTVSLFFALPATMLGFFGSSLALYIFHKDKSKGPVKDGVAV